MFDTLRRLPVIEKFVRFWLLYRRDIGNRLWVYIFLSLLVTLVESLGIGLIFPLMTALQGSNGPKSDLELKVDALLAFFGLSFNLPTILLCLIAMFTLKATIQFGAAMYQSKIIADYLRTITNRIYTAVSAQRFQSFLGRSIGTLSNATVNETYRAMSSLVKFATLFPSMISITIFSALALRVDWFLTGCVLGFGGTVLITMRLVSRYARRLSIENTEATGRLNELVLQTYGSFKYLRATLGMPPLLRQTRATVERLRRTQFLLSTTANLAVIMNEPIAVILMAGILWQQTVIARHPLSQVVLLAMVFYRLIKEVMTFQSAWHEFARTMGSIDLISNVIHEAERGVEDLSGREFLGIRREIRVEHVGFSYGDRPVLRDFSLVIPRNAMVALVGESGSGKSTLVDLLTGILRPASGKLLVDDVPLAELSLAGFRARVGYVTQEPALFSDTIASNISFWDQGDPAEVSRKVAAAAEAANCADFIQQLPLGFETKLGDRGVNLSGGQRQRLAIARELYKDPELLILDEATSALDSESELEVQKSIEGLRGKVTTVIIAHRLSTIRNADRICVLSEGRLVEEGQFSSLFQKENSHFRKYCDLQGLR